MPARIASFFSRCALSVVKVFPAASARKIVLKIIAARCSALSPGAALRFLFELDAALYRLEGNYAIAYGGGVHTKHRHTRYHDFFISRIGPEETVLDIGCGNGALACDIAERAGALVTGIDMSEANLATAKTKFAHERVSYVLGNALQDLPAQRFDTVVLSNVLEHIADRQRFLATVIERVAPRKLLLRVPLFEREWRVPLKQELGVDWRLDPTHETEYTLESFAAEIRGAGLQVVHQEVRWGEIWAEAVPCINSERSTLRSTVTLDR
jgi:SAM-dependent methyltransferase